MKSKVTNAVFTVNPHRSGSGSDLYGKLTITVWRFDAKWERVSGGYLCELTWYSGGDLPYWYGFSLGLQTDSVAGEEIPFAVRFLKGFDCRPSPEAAVAKFTAMGAKFAVRDARVCDLVPVADLAPADEDRWEVRTEKVRFHVLAPDEISAIRAARVRWAELMTGGYGQDEKATAFAGWIQAGNPVERCNAEAPMVRPMSELLAPIGKAEAKADVAVS